MKVYHFFITYLKLVLLPIKNYKQNKILILLRNAHKEMYKKYFICRKLKKKTITKNKTVNV